MALQTFWLLALFALLGCSRAEPQAVPVTPKSSTLKVVVFRGMCDASGAVALDGQRFAVADDEDSILRVYDARKGGAPLSSVDVSTSLELERRKGARSQVALGGKKKKAALAEPHDRKKAARSPETDIEAATGMSEHAFWLTSHGRDSKGELQPSRFRFFATSLPGPDGKISAVGKPYTQLLADLLAAPQLATCGLAKAAELAPKDPGGLNLEGMTADPDGQAILIGFRSPLIEGKALAIWLLNPLEVVLSSARARLGNVELFDLGQLGIRGISWWRGSYLIIGGAPGSEPIPSRLFVWDGKTGSTKLSPAVDFDGINPEAFVSFEDSSEILVLSDDGTVPIAGNDCKKLKEADLKEFRGVWVKLKA